MLERQLVLVEAEDSIRAFLQKLLRREGYVVSSFARAGEALAHMRGGYVPHVIVVDAESPPGQALQQQLRRNPVLARVPIVSRVGDAAEVVARVNQVMATRPLPPPPPDAVAEVVAGYGSMAARLPGLLARVRELAEERGEDVEAELTAAHKGGRRMQSFVRYLRDFGRASGPERAAVEIGAALDFAIATAQHELAQVATLDEARGETPRVMANERELSHVFLSLLINAAHAMEPGRAEANRVTITCGSDENGWAFVEVADTGSGIAPEVLPRIFEPYFSTKKGAGMGLGLFIARSLVSRWGGELRVRTELGRGSTFRVELPPAPVGSR